MSKTIADHEDTPRLVIAIHTEEEFDWSKPFDPTQRAVTHVPALARVQAIFEAHGARPMYLMGHPIVAEPRAVEVLRAFVDRGAALIGTHLHPWVAPPVEEEISARNSYPGNLPEALERAKLTRLTEAIERAFDRRPRTYLAGRYGYGPRTGGLLRELGYTHDLSPSPGHDFTGDGGPDHRHHRCAPFEEDGLTRIPHTTAQVGFLCRDERPVLPALDHPWARRAKLTGLLARLGALRRPRLSPEGFGPSDLTGLTRSLIHQGRRVFVLSFHSPSVAAGHTPYVRDEADVDRFHETVDRYLAEFRTRFGGVFVDPETIGLGSRPIKGVPFEGDR